MTDKHASHAMDECPLRCRFCGLSDAGCFGKQGETGFWCCYDCHHCAKCSDHPDPCHLIPAPVNAHYTADDKT